MIPIPLNAEQQQIVDLDGNTLVTACPGSGKTRVLTAKVLASAVALQRPQERVAAVTFTNRAADEIKERVRCSGYAGKNIWTGTIHAFSLEWILRPFSCYHSELKNGFSLADEFRVRRLVDELRPEFGVDRFAEVRTSIGRDGELVTRDPSCRALIGKYRSHLRASRLIDFDQVLYFAYELVQKVPGIGRVLSAIFSIICIDEYQDTQDLQYGILSSVVRNGEGRSRVFIVGDVNQAIYTSLGGVAKSHEEIRREFGIEQLEVATLSGNYRSTQRIVDFFGRFGTNRFGMHSLAEYRAERGLVTYSDQDVAAHELPEQLAGLIRYHLISGVPEKEICVLAPTWPFATAVARQLAQLIPEIGFDAPGISPLRYQPDSIWFQLARLFLTEPHPSRYASRLRWASELINNIERENECANTASILGPRGLLRMLNGLEVHRRDSLGFLGEAFEQCLALLGMANCTCPSIDQAKNDFLDGVRSRMSGTNASGFDVDSLRRLFRYPSGVVVSSCHGVKGEEFEVVICFGLLRGRIPHWSEILDDEVDEVAASRNMLYVIASRARRYLHLFSESGRTTSGGREYESTREVSSLAFDYDDLGALL